MMVGEILMNENGGDGPDFGRDRIHNAANGIRSWSMRIMAKQKTLLVPIAIFFMVVLIMTSTASIGAGETDSPDVSDRSDTIGTPSSEIGLGPVTITLPSASWAPSFINVPSNGQETQNYSYRPEFNETVTIIAQETNATFLAWNGTAYVGTPNATQAGLYWINITARSDLGTLTSYQNSTFLINGSWAPSFDNGPVTSVQETIEYVYGPGCNESDASFSFRSNATFLTWNGTAISGTPGVNDSGTYFVNLTATSLNGKLSSYLNYTLIVSESWSPAIINEPSNGRETVFYSFEPVFNETVIITVHDTNATFLTWNGTAFAGTPNTTHAGTYWINITACSVDGKREAYLNRTITIGESWAPTFVSEVPNGPFYATLTYQYFLRCNESVNYSLRTDAAFLNLTGSMISGNLTVGTYYVNISAYSINGLLTSYQNYTLVVNVDSEAPLIRITTPVEGAHVNQTSILFVWKVVDLHSGVANLSYQVDSGEWVQIPVSAQGSISIELTEGGHVVTLKVTDKVGNENSKSVTVTVDLTAPTATYHPNGDDVYPDADIIVEFSEAMDGNNTTISIVGVRGVVTWNGNVATFSPSSLDFNSRYFVNVRAKDLAGNIVTYSWQFNTTKAGDIGGAIFDEGGVPIPNATITLSNGMTTITDANGLFEFLNVPLGNYTLTATVDGYGAKTMNVTVSSSETADVGGLTLISTGSDDGDNDIFILAGAFVLVIAVLSGFLILRRRKG